MGSASCADWVEAIGQLIEGLAAAVAVAAGWRAASTWRDQLRAPKEAEVAGEALAATMQFIAALFRMSSPYRTSAEQVDDVHRRWRTLSDEEEVFRKILGRATAHLPDAAASLLVEVWDCRTRMQTSQWVWAMSTLAEGHEPAADLFKKAFGREVEQRLDELKTRAIAELKPLARLEPKKKS